MRMRTITVLALFLGTSGLPVYWVLAGEGDEGQPKYTVTEVELKLAEAHCELARQNLARVRAERRAPILTRVHEEAVQYFEQELADLKGGKRPDSFERLLAEMRHLAQLAERRVQGAVDINAKSPEIITDREIAMLRAKRDILRLGTAHGELLRSADRQEKIDWQLEQLRTIQLLLAERLFDEGM